jgi:two-component sensor histidine kinase
MGMTLSLVFYELATNATKHGALSMAGGSVSLAWRLGGQEEGDRLLHLEWCEEGGPPVSPPREPSFGTKMIERVLSRGLGGKVDMTYAPEGFRLAARIPLA